MLFLSDPRKHTFPLRARTLQPPVRPPIALPKENYVLLHFLVYFTTPKAALMGKEKNYFRTAVPLVLALSCFCPLQDCPMDGTQGLWVPCSHAGLPDPWVEAPFPCVAGESLVLESRTIHCGGGRSPAMPPSESWRVVAFATLSDSPRNYNQNAVAFRPPWAVGRHPCSAAGTPLCAAPNCTHPAATSATAACAPCGAPLCIAHSHAGALCATCSGGGPGGPHPTPAAPTVRRDTPGQAILALMPGPGTELLTMHTLAPQYGAPAASSSSSSSASSASFPALQPCPLEDVAHFHDGNLPNPQDAAWSAAITSYGSILVLTLGHLRGLATLRPGAGLRKTVDGQDIQDEEIPICHWWQWEMVPRAAVFMDPAVAEKAGYLVPYTAGWSCPCSRQVCHIALPYLPWGAICSVQGGLMV